MQLFTAMFFANMLTVKILSFLSIRHRNRKSHRIKVSHYPETRSPHILSRVISSSYTELFVFTTKYLFYGKPTTDIRPVCRKPPCAPTLITRAHNVIITNMFPIFVWRIGIIAPQSTQRSHAFLLIW